MPALDQLKEEVAYLKLWQGIVIVTDISLAGWLVSAVDTAERLQFFLAVLGVILLSLAIAVLHRKIERRMDGIGRL
jgi:multidrug transporter EmrE-like cation transporter